MHEPLIRSLACIGVCVTPLIGCQSAWAPPAEATAQVALASAVGADAQPATSTGPRVELSQQQALSEVAPLLKQLAEVDPAAHAQTLDQLAAAKPSLWKATVERALATHAYRTQLSGGGQAPPAPARVKPARATAPPAEEPPVARVAPPKAPTEVAPSQRVARIEPTPRSEVRSAYHEQRDTGEMASTPAELELAVHEQEMPGEQQSAVGEVRLVASTSGFPSPEPGRSAADRERPRRLPESWQDQLDATIAMLKEEIEIAPQDSATAYQHARLRLLQLAAGRKTPAVEAVPGVPGSEQAFWSQQLYAISTLLDDAGMPDRRRRATAASHYQVEATAQLSHLASLEVGNLTFCSEIYGFGAYEPIDEPRFRAGDRVRLYAEVEHYLSKATPRGLHTSLSTRYRLLGPDGDLVDEGEFPVVEDYCLAIRRDFHIQYRVPIPAETREGKYELEIEITDKLSQKVGKDRVRFEIVAP